MESISVQDLEAVLTKDGVVLIDVREPYEYEETRIAGAVNIPMSTLMGHTDALKKKSVVYLYCFSGGRSLRACQTLQGAHVHAINVEGGLHTWETKGFPVVRGRD